MRLGFVSPLCCPRWPSVSEIVNPGKKEKDDQISIIALLYSSIEAKGSLFTDIVFSNKAYFFPTRRRYILSSLVKHSKIWFKLSRSRPCLFKARLRKSRKRECDLLLSKINKNSDCSFVNQETFPPSKLFCQPFTINHWETVAMKITLINVNHNQHTNNWP